MVLGVDWMKRYSPIMMDFNEMTLKFKMEEKEITLQGGQHTNKIKLISEGRLQKMTEKDLEILGEIYLLSAKAQEVEIPERLLPLLQEYHMVFEEPKGMPPQGCLTTL
ncbi:hypothetical protein HRI_004714100 [Hibiscus trionum]|uniref:Uncharacterized protein n=1 Tax=Hibiscus trionum TaxID=183268 RepID=A0A9W7MPZ2_HIBTR|nr:hypothetical protein HRI_004714100 [Hibiscus trionum]